jgi:hypothetical protein
VGDCTGAGPTQLLRLWHLPAPFRQDVHEGSAALLPPHLRECQIQSISKEHARITDDPYRQSRKASTDVSQRKEDWEDSLTESFREELRARIESLSDAWKKDRAAKEEQRKKDLAEGKEAETVGSSDSEIDIEDVTPAPPTKPPPSKGKTRANRLRG